MPSREQVYVALFSLHERLVAGDPTILGDVAKLVFEPLIAELRNEFRGVDDHVLQEKAAVALIEYGKAPSQANARAGAGVMGFLVLRARSRVMSELKRDRRREEAETRYANERHRHRGHRNPVELRRVLSEHIEEDATEMLAEGLDPVEEVERQARRSDVLEGAKTEVDGLILSMMLAGIRATSQYAKVLGIEDRPFQEQRRIVKQHKDRLKVAATRRQEEKRSGPKRRGRPPRDGSNRGEDRD